MIWLLGVWLLFASNAQAAAIKGDDPAIFIAYKASVVAYLKHQSEEMAKAYACVLAAKDSGQVERCAEPVNKVQVPSQVKVGKSPVVHHQDP
ncbi:secretion protein HlyD [Novimethylophilus kurashikiensis]|uniref:Secretion protein HlyD n=1 Tax=Novimethylophilus kurashikiensis TaxID=1825523 RepID=A0A2R5F8B0_9PROT|nr:hypothetical protein [Novimethylophilus kurashikiensis]GBG14456.1 secretion protein HlyD [Novimethylophilus kurashikiensis]